MDLTQSRQFQIITHPKVNFSFIIYYLTYLILINQFILNWQHYWLIACYFFRYTYIRGYIPIYWATYNLNG